MNEYNIQGKTSLFSLCLLNCACVCFLGKPELFTWVFTADQLTKEAGRAAERDMGVFDSRACNPALGQV